MPTDNVLDCGRDQQIFLFQSQLLALFRRIIRIENTGNIFGLLPTFQCFLVLSTVEGNKIELIDREGLP